MLFYMVQPQIGYIHIEHFGATTAGEFKEALTKLKKEGMKNLILDLQGNGEDISMQPLIWQTNFLIGKNL